MIYEYILATGNILLIAAAYPQIKAAWRDRNHLNGFSLSGSFLTFAGVFFIGASYVILGSLLNMVLILPTALYWGLVTWHKNRLRIRAKKLV